MSETPELPVLQRPVTELKGVGPVRGEQLGNLQIHTLHDLLRHPPHRYEDRSTLANIGDLEDGQTITVVGTVTSIRQKRSRRYQRRLEVTIKDETGEVTGVFFNQAYLKDQFKRDRRVIFHGKVSYYNRLQFSNPAYELLEDEEEATAGIIPIYPATDGLTQSTLRRLIDQALTLGESQLSSALPETILDEYDLLPHRESVIAMHRCESLDHAEAARRSLAFEEFLLFQLSVAQRRRGNRLRCSGRSLRVTDTIDQRVRRLFPFEFTNAQNNVINEICRDMQTPSPMNRLVQGDVGSGKTAVALYAMLVAIANKAQAAFMAPTEILAQQHLETLSASLAQSKVRLAYLGGSTPAKEKKAIYAALEAGDIDLVIGTHALIQDPVVFRDLGLVVIDEQHKFGVNQRASLLAKGEHTDLLLMSATPIPRSLAMTVFGDLDVSLIDELPPGRKPVKTHLVTAKKRNDAYAFISDHIKQGCQVYTVCPLIEESETLDLANATAVATDFADDTFKEHTVALMHGKLKNDQKHAIMERFHAGDIDILVSTVVIEVGVNVPRANIMIIEEAQRFGLAQLHQLRGRIGRGGDQAYCLLFAREGSQATRERLSIMTKTNDGFKVSEADLQLRGPGDFLGTRQHGLPRFHFGDIVEDFSLLEAARECASAMIDRDPELSEHPALQQALKPYANLSLNY